MLVVAVEVLIGRTQLMLKVLLVLIMQTLEVRATLIPIT
jgi:hypothetical protein